MYKYLLLKKENNNDIFLKLNLKNKDISTKYSKTLTKNKFKYTFKFVTIFIPCFIKSFSLTNLNSRSKKVLVKQSYLLLVWMYYLNNRFSSTNNNFIPKIFVYPSKRNYKVTLTKAPMAHKTYSQEQFKFNFYVLGFSFTLFSKNKKSSLTGINDSLFLIKYIFSKNLTFSTNMLFLKKFIFIFHLKTADFFYYKPLQ